jgi:4-hydroxybenzoate polyprenyltransferase
VPVQALSNASRNLASFSKDIKIAHTVFSMPFLVCVFFLGETPLPTIKQMFLVIICAVCARSYAMGMNRIIDRDIDHRNSRTQGRAIPMGAIELHSYAKWTGFFGVLFIVFASLLSWKIGMLALPLLIVLAGYSYMKRLTLLTHWYLGGCLGLAPIAAQLVITGTVTASTGILACAVMMWTAGFDIIYSLQDREFDSEQKLYSVPSRLGHRAALTISFLSFLTMVVLLLWMGTLLGLGPFYYCGVAVICVVLMLEHWLVRDAWSAGVSKRMTAAFFTSNAMVSLIFLFFVVCDYYYRT